MAGDPAFPLNGSRNFLCIADPMTIANSIGELFVLGFRGSAVPRWVREFAREFGLGGVILFDYDVAARRYGRNVRSPSQVRELCAQAGALPSAPMVFVDQEGGKVRRLKDSLGFAPLPSALAFNRLPLSERESLAARSLAELRQLGFSFNLAPVADLNLNPANPDIGAVERSYSAQPEEVRANVEILAEAARKVGLGLCLKHYPGLGGAEVNSHEELTDLSGSIDQRQLALFERLAPKLPGTAILVSHGIVNQWEPGQPVSMSAAALSDLRSRVPGALLISDDLQMQGLQRRMKTEAACVQGIRAGMDLLLIGNNLMDESRQAAGFARALAASTDESHLASSVDAALERVRERKRRFGAVLSQTFPSAQ